MGIDNGDSTTFPPPASRSYLFGGGVLTLVDLGTAAVLLFKHLASMPFSAVTAIVAAMFMLVWSWRPILHNNEQMRSFIQSGKGDPKTAEILRVCANSISGSMFVLALISGLLLLVIAQIKA